VTIDMVNAITDQNLGNGEGTNIYEKIFGWTYKKLVRTVRRYSSKWRQWKGDI
jgi:hypothetical protein